MASWWDTAFGGGAEKEAAQKNIALAQQYGTDAQGYLKSAYDTGRTDLGKGISAFDPLSTLATKYNAGGDLYLDALGINGPGGNQRAVGAFRDEPGYAGAVAAGQQAIERRRGGGYMSNSGNADIDALTFGQNMQDQQYQRWLQQLQGTGQTGIGLAGQVAQGQAGGFTNLANLGQQFGQNQVGVAGNVLSADTSANALQASGEASGAKNLLGAGLSLASLAMAPFTGGASLAGMAGGALRSGSASLGLGRPFMGGGSPTGY